MKRTKLVKKKAISVEDAKQMEDIYSIRPTYVSGLYITPVIQDKCTFVRVTFTEYNASLNKHIPSVAIVCTIEDLQNMYNAWTVLLQNMRDMGKIS